MRPDARLGRPSAARRGARARDSSASRSTSGPESRPTATGAPRCRTSTPAGDVAGYWQLAHTAFREGEIAAENATGHEVEIGEPAVPRPIYTDPEIAGVGLTEAEAREQHGDDNVAVGRFPWVANARAVMSGETTGWVKSIHETTYGELLGVVIVGPHATDLIEAARRRARRRGDGRDGRRRDRAASRPSPRRSRKRGWSRSAGRSTSPEATTLGRVRLPSRHEGLHQEERARRLHDAEGRSSAGGTGGKLGGRKLAAYLVFGTRLRRRPRRRRGGRRPAPAGGPGCWAAPRGATRLPTRSAPKTPTTEPAQLDAEPSRDRARLRRVTAKRLADVDPKLDPPRARGARARTSRGSPSRRSSASSGLERVVKLASNEGPFGPFPAALEAIERASLELNRYPDGGATGSARRSPSGTASASRRSSSAPAPTP